MGACTWLGSVNANQMLNLAISQGLSYGNDPVVGGVICWDNGGDGHCAVIERVIDANTVETTESGWNYTAAPIVRNETRYRVGGSWVYQAGYTYQGIFYPPHAIANDNDYYMLFIDEEGWK